MTVHIGTSGFLYDHWRGRFYPPSVRGHELEWYADRFDTVELNVTFYRTPSAATFRAWARRVPAGFTFAVKASRYLTHVRRLREAGPAVRYLLDRIGELGDHLGPVLVQLPPDMPADIERLRSTLDAFPAGVRVALEPRHPSWFRSDVRAALESADAALCLTDRRGPRTPLWATADWGYVRFHEGRASPRSCYGRVALSTWARRIDETLGPGRTVYVYFNNDPEGCALRDGAVLARRLTAIGIPVAKRPDVPADVVSPRRRQPSIR